MKLRVVVPIVGDIYNNAIYREVSAYASEQTVVDVVSLDVGASSIESAYDEVLVGPDTLHKIQAAAEDGCDACFVSCFADPAVHAARELVEIPVMGGFTPAISHAIALGERISIITVLANVRPMLFRLARAAGVESRLASIRVIDTPVLELEGHDELVEKLSDQGRLAVDDDGADVLVLGCTGMLGVAAALQEELASSGPFVPVVDPTAAAVTWLEAEVRMGLRPSRRSYMPPPVKARNG